MALNPQNLRRYIIMDFGDPVGAPNEPAFTISNATVTLDARAMAVLPSPKMRVLDEIPNNGPKLVEMPAEGELSLRLSRPGIKIVPEVFYRRQWERLRAASPPLATKAKAPPKIAKKTSAAKKAAAPTLATEVTVTDRTSGKAVAGAQIVAFTDFAARAGANAQTSAIGRAVLKGIAPSRKLDRVYVYGPDGYWGFYESGTTASAVSQIELDRIDVQDPTLLLTQLYGALPLTTGTGVTIGIIDSGVDGTHPDLANVTGGSNCVGDETRNNPAAKDRWGPARIKGEHGTHVAGTAAGRGTSSGFRGVAPGAAIRSYRVFPDTGKGASNFDIAKAIETAIIDKCDIVNMSLGGGPKDDLTRTWIDRAIEAGVVVVAAAGNDGRQPVSYPAALPACVAVSAMGRIGTFPKQSMGTSDIAPPKPAGAPKDFIAAFSNFGTEIDVTGPGVEIVSTLPGSSHGAMSGTSMAAPAIAGFCAHLLSVTDSLKQKTGADRSRALKDLLYASCKPVGFGRDYEGFGLPMPEAGEA